MKKVSISTDLTEEQMSRVSSRIADRTQDPPSIDELCVLAFGDKVHGNDRRVKTIKRMVANQVRPVALIPKSVVPLKLTDDQKGFVASQHTTMSSLEIARVLFPDSLLTNTSPETNLVAAEVRIIGGQTYSAPNDVLPVYSPPDTVEDTMLKVRRHDETFDPEKMTERQRKDIESLFRHLRAVRFVHQMSMFQKQIDRDLCEATFIRHIWTKASDLSNEECDIFMILANEAVIEANIKRRIELLQCLLDDNIREAQGNEKSKFSMAFAELIGKIQTEYNACIGRQKSLLAEVNVKRSERIKYRVAEAQSLATLIDFWKTETGRRRTIVMAERHRKELREEAKHLSEMDDLIVQIFGVSQEELAGK